MKHDVYVRAQTSDNRWATINAVDLTDDSFKKFVLHHLAEAGIVSSLFDEGGSLQLQTNLTKMETENE